MSSAIDGYFMSIHGSEGKSFEEIRIDDYIKAYLSTGRPPQPCPQQPENESQRKALNLPPLFKPHPIRNATLTINGTDNSATDVQLNSPARITDPAKLPIGQEFRLHSASGEKYHCISCMPQYTNFSQEELRYYAYLAGNIKPPISVIMDPFVQTVKETSTSEAYHLIEDQLQSISAQPQYDKHSHEELRLAFLRFGREMTSAELQNLSVNPSLPPIQPIVTLPGRSIPSPAFAALSSTSIPKFTFGLR